MDLDWTSQGVRRCGLVSIIHAKQVCWEGDEKFTTGTTEK